MLNFIVDMITYDSFFFFFHVDIKTLSLCFADLNSSHVHVVFLYIPCHRKYSQSEYRKPVVFLTVLYPTFPSCAALILLTTVYFSWFTTPFHGTQACSKVCVYQENISDLLIFLSIRLEAFHN